MERRFTVICDPILPTLHSIPSVSLGGMLNSYSWRRDISLGTNRWGFCLKKKKKFMNVTDHSCYVTYYCNSVYNGTFWILSPWPVLNHSVSLVLEWKNAFCGLTAKPLNCSGDRNKTKVSHFAMAAMGLQQIGFHDCKQELSPAMQFLPVMETDCLPNR